VLKLVDQKHGFARLTRSSMSDLAITECGGLQEMICNSPEEFFAELGQRMFVLGKEVKPSSIVQDRIDILALDSDGNAVVIELKRGNNRLQLLQAISYAGMISRWEPKDFLALLPPDKAEALSAFLEVEQEEINRKQRILLIAEAYDYEVLIGAEWLSENYGVEILCSRVLLSVDKEAGCEYMSCTHVFPTPELAKQAITRGFRETGLSEAPFTSWKAVLDSIKNPALAKYFQSQIAANRSGSFKLRRLNYRAGSNIKWYLTAYNGNGYGVQMGRFKGDIELWQSGVSAPKDVKPVHNGERLRVLLHSDSEFEYFHHIATEKAPSFDWLSPVDNSAQGLEPADQDNFAEGV
jgi:hypothetical protein